MHGAEQPGGLQAGLFDLPENALAVFHFVAGGDDGGVFRGIGFLQLRHQILAAAAVGRCFFGMGRLQRQHGRDQQDRQCERKGCGKPKQDVAGRRLHRPHRLGSEGRYHQNLPFAEGISLALESGFREACRDRILLYTHRTEIPLMQGVNLSLRAGMGAVIDLEQPRGVDAGIDLCRRQAGVAKQLLDGAQIATTGQEMGGEGMTKRMRCGRIRQAESAAQLLHAVLDDARLQLAAAGAAKERTVRIEMVGANLAVVIDRLDNDRQQRHQPRLVALAGDAQGGCALRHVLRLQTQRFGNAQAAAIEQGQHGCVACGDPGLLMQLRLVADDGDRLGIRERLGKRFRLFRRTHRGCTGGIHQAFLFEVTQQ
ncbi:hypothetical protein RHSP_59864 [Rhizobium freirei PRF 81]|uniref:Uncharacterized protein n=1 Tax=Rhizobium freirei PRF 81 TaxID=363754 RepID=N6UH89_9HYPH|nr:hypothetical protein RHSP_59864 [Rhizobium freirei PRF 81]